MVSLPDSQPAHSGGQPQLSDTETTRPFTVRDKSLLARVQNMPKIELHRHFEGALRLQTMFEIAREHNIAIPPRNGNPTDSTTHHDYTQEDLRPTVQVMPDEPRTPQDFLAKFRMLRQFFRSEAIIRRLTHEIITDAANDNVRYMELRFTPHALCKSSGCTIAQIVPIICDVASATAREHPIEVALIVSMNRHEPVELGEEALNAAIANQDKGVVGVDLAGDEANHDGLAFRNIFRRAKEARLGVTIHAGEWAGANSVWNAIGNLYADRVGHGINVLQDEAIAHVLAERQIPLEVCPTSNVLSGVASSLAEHPLNDLTQRNIFTTINTDDPSICAVTLSDEIALMIENSTMTLADVEQYTLRAARAAFLPPAQRDDLVRRFQTWFNDGQSGA